MFLDSSSAGLSESLYFRATSLERELTPLSSSSSFSGSSLAMRCRRTRRSAISSSTPSARRALGSRILSARLSADS